MGFMCVAFGHRFETLPLSGNRRQCIRCGLREMAPQDVAEAEVEYASRVSGVTPPLEGVTEEEFTQARRDGFEQTVKHVTARAAVNEVASMLGVAGGGFRVAGHYEVGNRLDLYEPAYRALRALLADRNATISKLRSKNERLWRRQRRLHDEIHELQGMLEAEKLKRELDEIEEEVNLAGPSVDDYGLTRIGGTG